MKWEKVRITRISKQFGFRGLVFLTQGDRGISTCADSV